MTGVNALTLRFSLAIGRDQEKPEYPLTVVPEVIDTARVDSYHPYAVDDF